MNMRRVKRRWDMQPNLGLKDRQIRSVIGTSMIVMPMLLVSNSMGLWSVMILAAVPILTTAIIGWDPLYAALQQSSYSEREVDIKQRFWSCANLGVVDRAVRFALAGSLLYALMTMQSMTLDLSVTLLAIPLALSAIFAWDPIYALFGINSFSSHGDVKAAEPESDERELAKLFDFPGRCDRDDARYPHAA